MRCRSRKQGAARQTEPRRPVFAPARAGVSQATMRLAKAVGWRPPRRSILLGRHNEMRCGDASSPETIVPCHLILLLDRFAGTLEFVRQLRGSNGVSLRTFVRYA